MRAIILLWCAAVCLICAGRTVVSGVVCDMDGSPLGGAIVKARCGKAIKAFANTRADGAFSLAFDLDADSLTITVDKLGYAQWASAVVNADQTLSVMLRPDAKQLREVVVSAPVVYQKGDTLRFNLAQFIGKGDVSLEDALKKVPGISVSAQGKISYMGKDISNFYIEGLDMLGGKYNLVTRNLPAEHVAGVEVLSNHNEAKMDRGKLSDNVALNVRLKEGALLRPVGTSEASAGAGQRKFLYELGATGMMFTPRFQATVSAKVGNIREFSQTLSGPVSVRGLTGNGPQSLAEKAIGSLSAGSPPIGSDRYMHISDRMVSVDAVSKISDAATLRVNSSYAGHRQSNASSSSKSYYTGPDRWLTVNNESYVCSRLHKPSLGVKYVCDSDSRYISNDFAAMGDFHEIDLPIMADGEPISQHQKFDNFRLSDELYLRFRSGRQEWNANTNVSYDRTPSLKLDIIDAEHQMVQRANSSALMAAQQLGTALYAGRSRWGLDLKVDYRRDAVSTLLAQEMNKRSENDMDGHTLQCAASPSYQYTTAAKRMELEISAPLRYVMVRGENRSAPGARVRFSHAYVDPSLRLRYAASSVSKWTLSAGYSHRCGDLLTLLTNEVAHDYRSLSVNSGILARNSSLSATCRYEFREPIGLWFASMSADYSIIKQNLMRGQYITDSSTSSSSLASDNRKREFRLDASASKGFHSIRSKISVTASYLRNRSMLMQQGMPTVCHGTQGHLGASANLRPIAWLEADMGVRISLTSSEFAGMSSDFRSIDSHCSLSVFPIERLELKTNIDFSRHQLAEDVRKSMALVDFKATYRIKSLRLRLTLNNMLNQKSYSYVVYSGLDTYAYDYALRGREVIFSLIFTK